MSRSQFVETVTINLGQQGALMPIASISAIPYISNPDGSRGAQAQAWNGRIGDVPAPSLLTNLQGVVSYYLDDGDYDIQFEDTSSVPRIQPFVRAFKVVSNPFDSGWVDIIPSSGFTATFGPYDPAVRVVDSIGYLCGEYQNTSGSTKPSGSTLGTIDGVLAPANSCSPIGDSYKAATSTHGTMTILIEPSGTILILGPSGVNDTISLDGITYRVV